MNKQNTIELAMNLIAKLESFRAIPYRDSKGKLTLGYGATSIANRPITINDRCTEAQAKFWLQSRILEGFNRLDMFCRVNSLELEDNQAATILSFIYNVGFTGFQNSSISRDLISGQIDKVATDLMQWNKVRVNGNLVFSPGLSNRRTEESQCFVDERKC